jgi:hypothetical protein
LTLDPNNSDAIKWNAQATEELKNKTK